MYIANNFLKLFQSHLTLLYRKEKKLNRKTIFLAGIMCHTAFGPLSRAIRKHPLSSLRGSHRSHFLHFPAHETIFAISSFFIRLFLFSFSFYVCVCVFVSPSSFPTKKKPLFHIKVPGSHIYVCTLDKNIQTHNTLFYTRISAMLMVVVGMVLAAHHIMAKHRKQHPRLFFRSFVHVSSVCIHREV